MSGATVGAATVAGTLVSTGAATETTALVTSAAAGSSSCDRSPRASGMSNVVTIARPPRRASSGSTPGVGVGSDSTTHSSSHVSSAVSACAVGSACVVGSVGRTVCDRVQRSGRHRSGRSRPTRGRRGSPNHGGCAGECPRPRHRRSGSTSPTRGRPCEGAAACGPLRAPRAIRPGCPRSRRGWSWVWSLLSRRPRPPYPGDPTTPIGT